MTIGQTLLPVAGSCGSGVGVGLALAVGEGLAVGDAVGYRRPPRTAVAVPGAP